MASAVKQKISVSGPAVRRIAISLTSAQLLAVKSTGRAGRFLKGDLLGAPENAPMKKVVADVPSSMKDPSAPPAAPISTYIGVVQNFNARDDSIIAALTAK